MRKAQLVGICLLASALAGPARSGDEVVRALASPAPGEDVPDVNPGDQIGIACNALSHSDSESDVRVVLTISAMPGEGSPGYGRVLATDEQVAHGAVRVRIPAVPDLEDHTVKLSVYVVDGASAQSCDAGRVKIVRSPLNATVG